MGFIIGIDIGGSTTKIIGLRQGALVGPMSVQAGDPLTSCYGALGRFINENGLVLGDIDQVVCTGVGASFLKEDIYGIGTQMVDEFMAIGLGGRFSSGYDNAIVVSMGTGTAIIGVQGEKIYHVCGTGVGGGTVLGLSRKLFGSYSFRHIMELAAHGDVSKIDLSIGDISRGPIRGMKPTTTASNFGKVSDDSGNADLALGVVNLVFQTVGIFAMMAARMQGTDKIVLTGNLSQCGAGQEIWRDLEELYSVRYIIPPHSDFSTAIGAALWGQQTGLRPPAPDES